MDKKSKLIILDYDGTIRPFSVIGIMEAYIKIILSAGKVPEHFFTDTASFLKWFSTHWMTNMINIGRTDEKFIKKAGQIFHEIYDPHVPLFPWVKNIVTELSTEYQLAIFTSSKADSVQKELSKLDIIDLFNPIIGSEHVKKIKPDPEGLYLLFERSNIDPENSVLIGDSYQDIEVGKKVGTKTGIVPWGITKSGIEKWDDLTAMEPDFTFSCPQKLLATFM